MSEKIQEDRLRELVFKSGVDLFGVAPMKRVEHIDTVRNLRDSLPMEEGSILVLGIRFFDSSVERAGEPPAESVASYSYIQYQIQRELIEAAVKLSKHLNNRGYLACPIVDFSDGNLRTICGQYEFHWIGLPDMRANAPVAVAAGLGEIGWNGMLLTPEYGPRQRVIGIITDALLEPSQVYQGTALCDKCFLCVKACPSKALSKTESINIRVGERTFKCGKLDEARCAWARCYGLVADEGPKYLGWKTPNISPPDKLTPEIVSKALAMKDPLQTIATYDTIIERCLQVCLPPHLREEDPTFSSVYRRKKESYRVR